MITINASPLVIAAALGLLGPAALSEDDETEELGGLWERAAESSAAATDVSALPGQLGVRIQLLPLDEGYVLDEGNGRDAGQSSWSMESVVQQDLNIENAEVTREFHTDGDALEVRTVVSQAGETVRYVDLYTRIG